MQLIKGWVLGREAPRAFMPWFARIEKPTGLGPPKLVSARVQPVSVADVAWAACEALERPEAAGEVFELGGPSELTWPELYTAVRDAMPMTNTKKKPVPIPGPMGVAMAKGAKAVGLAQLLPFGPDEPAMAQQDVTCSNDKAERLLGFDPVAFDTALHEYAGRI
jgi:NADH dehydrogenase